MKCNVCEATYSQGSHCPQCGNAPIAAQDARAILAARQEFMERSTEYQPDSRVSIKDKLIPWLGLLLGFVIFIFWMRACSTMGWRLF